MEAYNWIFFASRLANSQAGKNDVCAAIFVTAGTQKLILTVSLLLAS